jgi:hypothetical protein
MRREFTKDEQVRMRRSVALALVGMLFAACSSGEPAPELAEDPAPTEASPDAEASKQPSKDRPDNKNGRGKDQGVSDGPGRTDRKRVDTSVDEEPGAALAFPATGRYEFSQSGWEEFCQTTCSREDLPPRQFVDVFHRSTSGKSALVETFTRSSDDRESRSTIRYSSSRALITELFSKVTYGGVTFSDSIEPEPPIVSLTFPLEVGDQWSGSWSDETSGDYRVSIAGRDSIAGHEVVAIESTTVFSGRYDGEARLDAWIDPETNMILKSRGRLEIESNFGTYRTRFSATIDSGPGYR